MIKSNFNFPTFNKKKTAQPKRLPPHLSATPARSEAEIKEEMRARKLRNWLYGGSSLRRLGHNHNWYGPNASDAMFLSD